MFTGLIEEIGRVTEVRRRGEWQVLSVAAECVLEDTRIGDSIAIDGVCQTVTDLTATTLSVETLAVSLAKTTLGRLSTGSMVNLERAVTPATRLGGHFVQGHVDGVAQVRSVRTDGPNGYLQVALPLELQRYCVAEGSITIDGVSLTIAELQDPLVTVNVIPLTWNTTTLSRRHRGDTVNIEVDILGRYVERLLSFRDEPTLTADKLRQWGY